ncbi:superoxide dismutase, partial [Staphylococcus epidermidis]
MSSFVLPALSYDYDELEPYIDGRTLEIHHDKHHATYVNNLNNVLAGYDDLKSKPVEYLLSNLNSLPEEVQTGVR